MRRREFITLLGGAAVAWPLAARAQQGERVRRIGVLLACAAAIRMRRHASRRSCRCCSNWAGPTVATCGSTYRWAAAMPTHSQIRGGTGRARAGRHPGHGRLDHRTAATGDPHRADRVRVVIDPVGAGFVDSLARPGGNATGFTNFEYGISGKWLELLKQIAPGVTRAAVLRDPATPTGPAQFGVIQAVAPSLFCRGCSNWAGPSAATCGSTPAGPSSATEIRRHAAELVELAARRHSGPWRPDLGTVAASDPHRADRNATA